MFFLLIIFIISSYLSSILYVITIVLVSLTILKFIVILLIVPSLFFLTNFIDCRFSELLIISLEYEESIVIFSLSVLVIINSIELNKDINLLISFFNVSLIINVSWDKVWYIFTFHHILLFELI